MADLDRDRSPPPVAAKRRLFGQTLPTPTAGVLGQGLRFAVAGGAVAVVYIGVTTLLAEVGGLRFQVALVIGFGIAVTVHFSLQRVFVWTHHEEFALPLHRQAGRYLVVASVQYGVTAASTSLLPSALGVSSELVYLATVSVVLIMNFLVFRHRVFHGKPIAEDQAIFPTS